MIRCLAVDDEVYATELLAEYIGKVPFLELAGTTTSAIAAVDLIARGDIDLVFLDIQMPDLTGMQILKLSNGKCKVILVTAYPQYALEGYEYDVVDYLLKPVAFDRFYKAARKAAGALESNPECGKNDGGTDSLTLKTQVRPAADYIFVKGDGKNKFLKINHSDILYIEGMKNYVSIYTKDQRIVTYQALRDLETVLPQPPFYRIHKSYIIALDKITAVDGNAARITENAIPIGETYRDMFFKLISNN